MDTCFLALDANLSEDLFQMWVSSTNRTFEISSLAAQAASARKCLFPSNLCVGDIVGVAPA